MTAVERCPECGGRLAAGALGGMCARCLLAAALRHPSSAEAPHVPDCGDRIGPYRVVRLLGEGGMGIVYLAEQERPIARQVAVKVIKLGMDTQAVLGRFHSEQQALALMDHPHIAQVYEAGSNEQGRPYFAMEYVPGVPITAYCDAHRLDTRHRLALFLMVADAVQHAHQKGVIHRDLKPSNILVMERDGEPMPKIIDFGLAKATDKSLTEETVFTEAGVLMGTPEYMSPEQVSRDGQDLDTRTDIYSLGVLLYELLVGAVPFDSRTLRRAGYEEIRRLIRDVDPPLPTTRLLETGAKSTEIASRRSTDAGTLRKEIGGDLEWITMKALAKERVRRYPSASEMAGDIERHLRNEPVSAGPAGAVYRARKFVMRNRVAVGAALLISVALAASAVVSTAYYSQAVRQGRMGKRESYRANIAAAASDLEHQDLEEAFRRLEACERNLRGWEWRHLMSRMDSSVLSLWGRGHVNRFAAFAFSDGNLVWSSGENVNVWAAGARQRSAVYGGFGEILALSRDGHTVAVRPYRDHKTIRILDAASRKVLSEMRFTNAVTCATFSADGSRIALGLNKGGIALGSAVTGQITAEASAGSTRVTVVAFSPDASRLFSGSTDGSAKLWDANSLRLLATPFQDQAEISAAAFSPDGSVVSAAAGRTIRLNDARDGSHRYGINGSPEITALTFSPDGKHLACTTDDYSIRVIDTASGDARADFASAMVGKPVAIAFDPAGSLLYISSDFGEVLAWDVAVWGGGVWKKSPVEVLSIQFNANGSRILALLADALEIWDGHTAAVLARRAAPGPGSSPVTFSRDGTRAAWGHGYTDVMIWDGATTRTITGHHGIVTTTGFSPDGKIIASGSLDQTVRIWNAATGALLRVLELHEPVHQVVFRPDGRQLLIACSARTFQLWSTASWRVEAVLQTAPALQKQRAGEPVFSPDGRRIVCGFDGDEKIGVWDSRSGSLVATIQETHARWVMGFSPDGTRFLSLSDNGIVRVWDAQSLRPLLTVREKGIRSPRFTPDGDRILFAEPDGTVRQWDTRSSRRFEALVSVMEGMDRIDPASRIEPLARYIRERADLEAPVRQQALEQLQAYGDFGELLGQQLLRTFLTPRASLTAYQDLLADAERAAAVEPSADDAVNALGAAQYRTGRFQEAVATLEHCRDLRECDARINSAFLAMAYSHVGRQNEAEALLTKLKAMPPSSNPEEQGLLREVGVVVGTARHR